MCIVTPLCVVQLATADSSPPSWGCPIPVTRQGVPGLNGTPSPVGGGWTPWGVTNPFPYVLERRFFWVETFSVLQEFFLGTGWPVLGNLIWRQGESYRLVPETLTISQVRRQTGS